MRNLIIIVLYFNALSIYSQEALNWGYNLNFEDTSEYKYVGIDTNNIWYITKPQKQILSSPSYAIISDTNKYYPKNVKSSFQFKLVFDYGCDAHAIMFWHKYDFEINKDGGIIETSYNNGISWQNIIYDTIIMDNVFDDISGLYNLNDTISSFNNQPGFTGLQSEIKAVSIDFWNYLIYTKELDTMLLRFTIVSDSVDTNNEGWMLDDFVFYSILVGIYEKEYGNNIYISPNPSNSIITINSPIERIKKVDIISLNGVKIIEEYNTNSICIDKIPAGFYLIKINDKYIEKLLIE
jgi:hypothetical protein